MLWLRKEKRFLWKVPDFPKESRATTVCPEEERKIMSNKNNNQINIPQAREAMDRFKMYPVQYIASITV